MFGRRLLGVSVLGPRVRVALAVAIAGTVMVSQACGGDSRQATTAADGADAECQPTEPGNTRPSGADAGRWYTDGTGLWVALSDDGTMVAGGRDGGQVYEDGSVSTKVPWWREKPGTLVVEATALHGPGGRFEATVPSGYGDAGFQASGLLFGRPGCWQITGTAGMSSLTFVMEVRVASGP
jgi:hypothetical protein